MAKIEKEENLISYKGNVFARLFRYLKPHTARMIACLVLVLIVTVLELYRPMITGQAIDTIEGYYNPYVYTADGDITLSGEKMKKIVIEDEEAPFPEGEYAVMLYYNEQYYLFEHLDAVSAKAVYMSRESVDEMELSGETLISAGFSGRLMSGEELSVLRETDYSALRRLAVIYGIVLILNGLADVAEMWLLQFTGQSIIFTIRQQVFEHVHSLPLRFFDTNPVGRIVTRVTNDVESLSQMYTQIIIRLFRNTVLIIGYAVVMIGINLKLALLCFAFFPVILVLTVVFRTVSRRTYRIVRNKVSQLNTFLSENISGMKLIQVFAREKEKAEEFEGRTKDLYRSQMKELFIMAVFRPSINLIANAALAIILYNAGVSVLAGTLTIGTLYVFTNYIRSFFEPIMDIAEQFSTLQNALASAEKIFSVLDEENPIIEKENPTKLGTVKGKIEFRNVWFAYENEDYVLRDVSFTIEPGQRVAFVGATGAGKSSILNLIGRYYEIQKGEILIDGVNIRDLSTEEIRGAIGQVQQDVFVFTGDIKSNIRLLDDGITDERIRESAIAVNADRFIDRLPKTYDEPVTERGATLSAGQRQLLSFARTLAYDPRILVMDEATANIDTETEELIQDALETLMKGRTTIMVAHRLSTIQHADCIYVMHKGKIRESGTHQELLEKNGFYKKLYEIQKQ